MGGSPGTIQALSRFRHLDALLSDLLSTGPDPLQMDELAYWPDWNDWGNGYVPPYSQGGPDWPVEAYPWGAFSFSYHTDGYLGYGAEDLTLLAVDHVVASSETILDGSYPLSYHSYLITSEENEWAEAFAELLLNPADSDHQVLSFRYLADISVLEGDQP